MRIAMLLTASLAATLWTGCLKKSVFNCATDEACGTGGVCEPNGFCSVADGACASGRRFSDTAGTGVEGQCVGGGPAEDGPIGTDGSQVNDGPPVDMPLPTGCNSDFATITNGNPNHKYKFVATTGTWPNQQNVTCAGQSSYMAIPDDAAELAAIFALANVKIWLGVSDRIMENQFRDTKNQAYASLALSGNNGGKDCATTTDDTAPLVIEDCDNQNLAVVCECEE
jgi:hypothetical protein